ncbi:D-alanine--D-alanine ligase [Tissierella sp. MSJ-40]|uniref:D-alanine--D-alanine ligase n=1 Tax=Tissierella simiarum TaxID=2841534 RepID=A0ABS6E788_9FIRM|nr:D-alanine--D-alanine ligase [Tissierella simiarum]MBU5438785.1 D-alanine--D-alanine ligase [Tissierella simiarum]
MKTNIFVIYGGKSVEHEVSLHSASAIMNAVNKEKYNIYPIYITKEGIWYSLGLLKDDIGDIEQLKKTSSSTIPSSIGDFLTNYLKHDEKNIVFPALHGTNGEDGTIQGLLELLDIPYVGNEVLSSALGMDKVIMKDLFTKENIPQGKYMSLRFHTWKDNSEESLEKIEMTIGYPCFVKPARSGSSVGISRCENKDELKKGLQEAFLYDNKTVIEEEIIGREMQISVVGNDYPKASVVGEFIMERRFMDYNAKYLDGKLIPVIPARLLKNLSDAMRETAIKTFKILNCYGLVRVDYFVTEDNKFYVNEVNTMPGFTKSSMTPALWEKTDGTTYPQLIEKLIELAFERYEQKKSIINGR